ncbi:putative reverse transcriptase domain-containing protein [Tanacetum coccineum]|uniref:Reverse transcriptase domain-containing protein n=1 Tax=Tanacetum coccineum TaxID=301880 RepID=A0ABQ5BK99_9ASTR
MEESLRKFMSESAKRHEENSNLIKEIRASIDVAIRNQRASIKTLEIQIGQMSKKESYGPQFLEAYSYRASHIDNSIPRKEKDPMSFIFHCYINNVCFDNALADLGASVSAMPLSTYLNLGLGELAHTKFIAELTYRTVKHPKGIAENVLVGIGKFVFPVDFIILDMPEDVKVPLILGRPFLSTAHAKIDVFKRKITLRVGEEKIIFKTRLMGATLVLNRSQDPLYGDNIELNDLDVPLELKRDQVDDLMPTIEEGEVIKEVKARNDNEMVSKIFGYPSDYNKDEKIRIDCAYNLKFSCMIGYEFIHVNFFPNFPINVMSKNFYNSIMKDKIEFRGRNELGNWANVPIFIGNFCVLTDFTVVRDMDPYLDEGMGEVVVGEPFCKVSEQDMMNGISYSYQKLKGFYKGVLNLGPEYIRDTKMEEWLTHGHVNVHKMEW